MIYTLDKINDAVTYILERKKSDTLFFDAPMGSGKTTLIKALCTSLGVIDTVSSPTFNIVNEYQGRDQRIFHFDLYRVRSIDEIHDIGVEEYLDINALKLIEWPAMILPLATDYQTIDILTVSEAEREIRVSDVVYR